MAKSARPWIVTRHDPIEKLEENLWTVQGAVPRIPFTRRMFIIKRADGSLMFSGTAIPLDDAALAEVTAWGRPSLLVVPHDQHMIDARPFAEKLGLRVYGPKACEAKMRERAEIAGLLEDLPADPTVEVAPVAGTKSGEPAIIVRSGGGQRLSLLVSDAIQNNPRASVGMLPRLMGFAGGPKVVPVFKLLFTKDRAALKRQIDAWSDLPGLVRVVPCHGDVVADGAGAALKAAAAAL
ncbi:MAG TPA: hypothetical protein VKZ18_16320 [Polyangia bacterium]|nr:hypothetical protein [Polyangia bacterium]